MEKIVKKFNIFLTISIFIIVLELLIIGWKYGRFFETLNGMLILGTLYWLWRYTRATEDMKRQMIRQNDFAQRPIINLYFRSSDQNRLDFPHFAIRNVGNAPAYNISIDDIHLEEYWFAFDVGWGEINNVILEKEKDEKPLMMIGRTHNRKKLAQGSEALQLLLSKFDLLDDYSEDKYKKSEKRFVPFIIRYRGLDERDFYSIFKLYQKHPSVTDRIIEFIKTGEGVITNEEVNSLCRKIPKSKSIVEKMYS